MMEPLDVESSVRKALTILDCYRAGERELGVSEVARRTNIAKSTVHRLCQELTVAGYLSRTDHRAFALTAGVFELGSAAAARLGAGHDASRFLQQLTVLTGETSHLAILDGADVLYLDKIETLRSEAVPSRVGHRNPAHSTSLGKALLAWNRASLACIPLVNGRLQSFTPNTITSMAKLKQELDLIQLTGVAHDREERDLGVTCIAAPVRNHLGKVVAAISVASPTSRMPDDRMPKVDHVVRQAANGLSQQLGWGPRGTLYAVAGTA